jgi:hypothetical protein
MALSRTWYTDANIALSDTSTAALTAKSIIWAIKAILKGEIGTNTYGLWTCESSSIGSSYGASDLWTSSFVAANIVRATAGLDHSWIVLKSPAGMGPYYLCLDYSTSSDLTVTIITAKSGFTGGSRTARPTSVDEVVHYSVGSTLTANEAIGGKIHRVTDADGNFWIFLSKNGLNYFYGLFGFQVLANTKTIDTYKALFFHSYNVSGKGSPASGTGLFTATTAAAGGCSGRTHNGVLLIGMSCVDYFVDGISISSSITTANAADSLYDAFPVLTVSTTTNYKGIKGSIPDCFFVLGGVALGQGLAPGALLPATGTTERMISGLMAFPWTGVAPTL